ncbi:uncharacterized protein MYCFIDRAFT_78235 [Pseudocercospora fijiensis CIRAD86]|uniref:Uncharacterized protein n=1 Tax=Pseudocercospora fijiensis (strain CIRAD86) TaxID=383855 RepID=M2YS04_PSEFD|nr:uncharacterized protein MYCFIDRAFT_78235 [Pseudocercospora fijiensis CIRAD86]EME80525.1 hypothetical protein MYCFIDRAFT_78235 [Pseudocercospora fijiensis CIRAD86]
MVYENMTSASASDMLRDRLLQIAAERKRKELERQQEQEALEAKQAEKRNRKSYMERFGMTRKEVRKLMVWSPQRSGRQNLLEKRIVELRKQKRAKKGNAPADVQESSPQKQHGQPKAPAKKGGVRARKAVKS